MREGKLEGKVALVTGASRGIGKATAELFAREGAKVCVNYNVSSKEAASVVETIRASGGNAIAVRADVSKEPEVEAMAKEVKDLLGPVDVLVNNAAVLRRGDLFNLKNEDLDEMLDVNIKGVIFCTRAVGRQMVESMRGGKIVNISSAAGIGLAPLATTGYAMTKAAVMFLTKRFALEFGPKGINVNCIAPGFTVTDMIRENRTPEQFRQMISEFSPKAMLNRVARPEEIATAILFMATTDSSFTTGQTLLVDGGRIDSLSHGV